MTLKMDHFLSRFSRDRESCQCLNTDQKEVTRLGMDWEWSTSVTVSREGGFTRSGLDEVDEAEIFEGAENSLTMKQTYTHEFQCKYELQRYPFDSQVMTVI